MKKYDVIYSDPPWKFSSRGARSGRFGKLDYPTMTIKEIASLNVIDIVKDNSALFLWVPGAFIMDSNLVIESWGFKFVRMEAVWEKTKSTGNKHKVCGPWGMNEAEFLLMGVRGKMCGAQTGMRNLETIVTEPYPGKHSEKPNIFRERIKYRFGDVSRLEMFARQKYEGWDIWGNELKNDINL